MTERIDYGYETWSEKFKRKFSENPWVPIGCLATTTALVMASVKMRRGASKDMQYWLRARVAFQGFTVIALVAGSMAIQAQRKEKSVENDNSPRHEATAELLREQKKGKERAEFEERLKGAEMAHEAEKAIATRQAPLPVNEPSTGSAAVLQARENENGGSSWTRWFRWGSSPSSKSNRDETDNRKV